MTPASIYVGAIGESGRGRDDERRFQNPGRNKPIAVLRGGITLLLGVWDPIGDDDNPVVVAMDAARRVGLKTRFSMFMPLALLNEARNSGFATHETQSDETVYAFRASNIERYLQVAHSDGGEDVDQLAERRLALQRLSTRKRVAIRTVLKEAGFGNFTRLRTQRFRELIGVCEASGHGLYTEGGLLFSVSNDSPGIDAVVCVRELAQRATADKVDHILRGEPGADPGHNDPPDVIRDADSEGPRGEVSAVAVSDEALACLKSFLANRQNNRTIRFRTLLKVAGLGSPKRLRKARYCALVSAVEKVGYFLCDQSGRAYSINDGSPGIETSVRVRRATERESSGRPPTPDGVRMASDRFLRRKNGEYHQDYRIEWSERRNNDDWLEFENGTPLIISLNLSHPFVLLHASSEVAREVLEDLALSMICAEIHLRTFLGEHADSIRKFSSDSLRITANERRLKYVSHED